MTLPVVLVGGFLGAGKTSLLLAAAQKLAARGQRVGLVTNDQGDQRLSGNGSLAETTPTTNCESGRNSPNMNVLAVPSTMSLIFVVADCVTPETCCIPNTPRLAAT